MVLRIVHSQGNSGVKRAANVYLEILLLLLASLCPDPQQAIQAPNHIDWPFPPIFWLLFWSTVDPDIRCDRLGLWLLPQQPTGKRYAKIIISVIESLQPLARALQTAAPLLSISHDMDR